MSRRELNAELARYLDFFHDAHVGVSMPSTSTHSGSTES